MRLARGHTVTAARRRRCRRRCRRRLNIDRLRSNETGV